MRHMACLLGCSVIIASCTAPAPAPLPGRPTLCQLADNRQAYSGRVLTVQGYLLANLDHGSVITDPRCGKGVGISWSRESGSPRLQALREVVSRASDPAQGPLMVQLRVTGTMVPDELEGDFGRVWRLRLADAEILRELRVRPEDEDRYLRWFNGPSPGPFQPSR